MCIVLYILFGYSKGIHLFLFNLKTSKVQKQPLGMFCKKAVLKNFATFTQTSVLESLFNKVEGLKVCKFIKKRLQHRCFPVNIANFLKTSILENINELLNFLNLKLITIEYSGRQKVLGVFQNYCSCESYMNFVLNTDMFFRTSEGKVTYNLDIWSLFMYRAYSILNSKKAGERSI